MSFTNDDALGGRDSRFGIADRLRAGAQAEIMPEQSAFKVQMDQGDEVYCVHVCPVQPWKRTDGVMVTTAKVIAHFIPTGQECRLT